MQIGEAEFQQLLDALADLIADLDVQLSDVAKALLRNDTGRLERLLREAASAAKLHTIQRPFQEGRYSHNMAQALGLGPLAEELDDLKAHLGDATVDPALLEQLRRLIDRRLQDLTDLIKQAVHLELEKQDHAVRENQRLQSLADKNFYYLSEDEIRRMKEAVTKLAQRLKDVVAIRRRHAKRG